MYALRLTPSTHRWTGNYVATADQARELVALAEQKGASMWKASGMMDEGLLLSLTGKAPLAIQMITSGIDAWRSTGATLNVPMFLTYLAAAYTGLGQFEQAWHVVDEAKAAMEDTKEILWEPEVHRIAGEIALKSPQREASKAQACFEHALAVARQQQAKSLELRAAMSLARLWRSQGNVQQARELLAPVYGWFTEGFDTRDLKDAKALLDTLS
jgi:predicted ATPase